jgi:hypothetical protein
MIHGISDRVFRRQFPKAVEAIDKKVMNSRSCIPANYLKYIDSGLAPGSEYSRFLKSKKQSKKKQKQAKRIKKQGPKVQVVISDEEEDEEWEESSKKPSKEEESSEESSETSSEASSEGEVHNKVKRTKVKVSTSSSVNLPYNNIVQYALAGNIPEEIWELDQVKELGDKFDETGDPELEKQLFTKAYELHLAKNFKTVKERTGEVRESRKVNNFSKDYVTSLKKFVRYCLVQEHDYTTFKQLNLNDNELDNLPTLNDSMLYSIPRIIGFCRMLSNAPFKAKTKHNNLNCFRSVLYHMHLNTLSDSQVSIKLKEAMEVLSTLLKPLRKASDLEAKLTSRMADFRKRKIWMEPKELKLLHEEILKFINEVVKEFKDAGTLLTEELREFQEEFVVLIYLEMIAQRRQVLTYMFYDAIQENDQEIVLVGQIIQKLRNPKNVQGIPIPSYIKDLLDCWMDEMRPLLPNVNNNIKTCWINKAGQPAESYTITNWFANVINKYFPGKGRITPACLRRIHATHILMSRIVTRNPGPGQFGPEDMGNLMLNTFDTIQNHYMREDATDAQLGLQEAYKKSIGVNNNAIGNEIRKTLTGVDHSQDSITPRKEYPSQPIVPKKKFSRKYQTRSKSKKPVEDSSSEEEYSEEEVKEQPLRPSKQLKITPEVIVIEDSEEDKEEDMDEDEQIEQDRIVRRLQQLPNTYTYSME